ncbi:hypothetical protein [Iamia sp.]|uniref:hypothetical protein n=1 Tax=Iamia sp. TaxID=2722710 RepID=UPI002C6B5848|nr:hypothetical protein [Iamia sp.]HXH57675.1 hypothetical protein [Iamia sp.]
MASSTHRRSPVPHHARVPDWYALRGRRDPVALTLEQAWWDPPDRGRRRRVLRTAADRTLGRALGPRVGRPSRPSIGPERKIAPARRSPIPSSLAASAPRPCEEA